MKAPKLAVCILFLLTLGGCSGSYYKVPTPDYNPADYKELGPGEETATGILLFGLIPIQLNDKVERSVQSMIASRAGDAVTNLSVRERWYWAYILTIHKIDVTGTVLRKTN